MRPPAVSLSDVGHTYQSTNSPPALIGVDLTIEQGEFVAIVGPSGSGKSTLLSIMGLLMAPSCGEVRVNGREVSNLKDRELSEVRGREIGFVFQAFHLLDYASVLENVLLAGAYKRSMRISPEHARAALAKVELEDWAESPARLLSGGQRQRVAVARALVGAPRLLLCDEPTGNLDSQSTGRVMDLLRAIHDSGETVVVVTHDPQVATYADRVTEVVDGRVSDGGAGIPNAAPAERAAPERVGRWSRLKVALSEALGGLLSKKWRTVLTVLGSVLGVTTLVATLGLASTAGGQVSKQFDRLAATTVTGQPFEAGEAAYRAERLAQARSQINGLRNITTVMQTDLSISKDWVRPDRAQFSQVPIAAVDRSGWTALGARLQWGRGLDRTVPGTRMVVLGVAAARQLGVAPMGGSVQVVFIGGAPFQVAGVVEDVERRPDLLVSAIIATDVAVAMSGPPLANEDNQIVASVDPGAGKQVADELPLALVPEVPDGLSMTPPPDPRSLRDSVRSDLDALFLLLAAVTLLLSMVGIANTSLVSVYERRGEIGLRRALGARRPDIASQFLVEAALVGGVGGAIGTLLGVVVTTVVATWNSWSPVIFPGLLIAAPLVGVATGVAAGTFPALVASKTAPAEALRS